MISAFLKSVLSNDSVVVSQKQMIVLWDDDNSKYSYRSYNFHEFIATT